jgi:tetratricopeptide (TPR) repeat protein
LRATLTAQGKAALQGMPGVGKTQLALKYAERHRKDYAAVLWVSAASRETLLSGFAALAGVLNLPERNEADQEKAVAAVRRWLDTTEQTWLLILDNADELELLQDFLPSGRGHCLLTTRPHDVHALATAERVNAMEPAEGALLLLRRAGRLRPDQPLDAAAPTEQEQARALSAELGGLPLALDQAGAFVAATTFSLAEYLNLYRQRGRELRARRGPHPLAHPHVTETFSLAFAQVTARNPAAADLLRACAFLHPDAIPEELLSESAPAWGEPLAAALAEPLERAELFATLNRFALITRDPDAHTLTLHRVTQAVLQDELDEDGQRRWAERAVRVVNRGFPAVEFSNWPQCERLLPQAQAAAKWIARWDFAFVEGGRLLNNAAYYLHERGRFAEAEPFQQRALAILERALSPDHPAFATSLNNLAALYHAQGHLAEAEPLFQRARAIRERTLGPDHPHVAQSLNNLAGQYRAQGRTAEAEPLLQRALAIFEHTDHPDVAFSLNNLAGLYRDQGHLAEAEPLYRRALALRERALGPDHPHVAQSLNNLAELYRAQGHLAEAEPLYRRALAISERALGADHPDVAFSLNNLAGLYYAQGHLAEAEPLFQRARAIRERALGPDHPHVAQSLNNLAGLYHVQGRWAEAEPLQQHALAIRERALGPDHPDVAQSLNNLAALYHDQGRWAEAEPLYQRALVIRERALGPNHPDVATTLENYAVLLEQTDRAAEAAPLRERAQAIRERHAQANPRP